MNYRFPTEQGLFAMSIVAVVTMVFSMFAIYVLLMQMEFQKSLSFVVDEKLDFDEDEARGENDAEKQKKNEQVTSRYRVSKVRRFLLFGTVALITLLAYLLLVRTDAPSWLAWIGMGAILLVLLHSYFLDEIRRKRLDRLFAILTLVLLMTMAMHWTVYAQQQVANGQIHQGKARITGYDRTAYDQNKGKDYVSRTDLVVAWGGSWGCPSSPDIYCEAELKGALCETQANRFLEQEQEVENAEASSEEVVEDTEGDAVANENEDAGQVEDENEAAANENEGDAAANENEEDAAANENGEDAAANNNEDIEQLEEENEQLREENEQYKEEVEDYEEYAEDLTEALEEEYEQDYYEYYYDDDYYEDSYWSTQDWNSVWGDFACADMFSFDNFGSNDAFNATTPPGDDGWPFVNIYGNCKTCEAYIVDYFSTEHFQEVVSHKKSARNYGLATGLGLVITILFAVKQRINPATDHEIELLSRHGTTSFA